MTIGPSILHNSELEEFLQEVEITECVIERRNAITSWVYTAEFKKKWCSKKLLQKIRYDQCLEEEYSIYSTELEQ